MTIVFTISVYRKLIQSLNEDTKGRWYPRCYLLGSGKRHNRIEAAEEIETKRGCWLMSELSTKALTNAYIKIVTHRLTPFGIVKVDNITPYEIHNIGESIYQIPEYGLKFISIDKEGIYEINRNKTHDIKVGVVRR